jgi:hypothetical protein
MWYNTKGSFASETSGAEVKLQIVGRMIIRMNRVCAAMLSGIVVVGTVIQVVPTALVHPLPLAKPTPIPEIKKNADLMLGHKGEEQMNQRVKEFFLQYERATSSDVSEIGGLYADTFMFGGPNGVQAVKKRGLPQSSSQNEDPLFFDGAL